MTNNQTKSFQHEAGDRTFVLPQSFADFVAAHPFVAGDDRLRELAARIGNDLGELYQAIWATDCGDEPESPSTVSRE